MEQRKDGQGRGLGVFVRTLCGWGRQGVSFLPSSWTTLSGQATLPMIARRKEDERHQCRDCRKETLDWSGFDFKVVNMERGPGERIRQPGKGTGL